MTKTKSAWQGVALLCLWGARAASAAPTPEGKWITVDDVSGKAKSIVSIQIENGELHAVIDSLLADPGRPANPVCKECPGEFQNRPLLGLRFLWGLTKDGEKWDGGKVLDPDNGKIYRCSVRLDEDGRHLTIRGYIGISLLGRSQTWERLD